MRPFFSVIKHASKVSLEFSENFPRSLTTNDENWLGKQQKQQTQTAHFMLRFWQCQPLGVAVRWVCVRTDVSLPSSEENASKQNFWHVKIFQSHIIQRSGYCSKPPKTRSPTVSEFDSFSCVWVSFSSSTLSFSVGVKSLRTERQLYKKKNSWTKIKFSCVEFCAAFHSE